MVHLFSECRHLYSRLCFHPSPLFSNSRDIPIRRESAAKCVIDLLPGEGLYRGRGRVGLLILDRIHVVLDQREQGALLLGDPILRSLPLLQQHRSRFRGHSPAYLVARPRLEIVKHRLSSNLKLIHADTRAQMSRTRTSIYCCFTTTFACLNAIYNSQLFSCQRHRRFSLSNCFESYNSNKSI